MILEDEASESQSQKKIKLDAKLEKFCKKIGYTKDKLISEWAYSVKTGYGHMSVLEVTPH